MIGLTNQTVTLLILAEETCNGHTHKIGFVRVRSQTGGLRKRRSSFSGPWKDNHLSGHKRRLGGSEPGGTSVPLDCSPK